MKIYKKLKQSLYKKQYKLYNQRDIDPTKDYYKILEVDKTASDKEIKQAYHKLARQYHPDANQGKTIEKFKEISSAYEILSDKQKRSVFDSYSNNNPFSGFSRNFKQQNFNQGFGFKNAQSTQSHNFYSDFENSFKNKYNKFYESYTYTDKSGNTKTYTYKNNGNPFYQDFNEILREKREKRQKEKEEYTKNYHENYQNTQNQNPFDSFNREHYNPRHDSNQNQNNFKNFHYHQQRIYQEEVKKLLRIIGITFIFTLLYFQYLKRRKIYYENQFLQQQSMIGNAYYEPVQYPQYHNTYQNNYNDKNKYNNNLKRQYFTRDEVPPYK